MKASLKLIFLLIILAPFYSNSQVTPKKDSVLKKDSLQVDSTMNMDFAGMPKKDTVVIKDTVAVVKKNCYTEWHDTFRARGAKPVPDGMQQVVISLKGEESCQCFMGQVEVVGGKIKPPLYFQQENGEFKLVSLVGKKLEPAFTGSMTPDELYAIKDGMSIVFRTTDNEYGRLFFYKYVNKSAQSNKEAPSPSDLIKD